MDWRRLFGVVAVAVVIAGIAGVVVTLVSDNTLLRGSQWQLPALVSLGVTLCSIVAFTLLGGPSRRGWETSYW